MKQETYNGWRNYATWLVALHIDNDQTLQHHAMHIWEMGDQNDCDWGLYDYGQALKEWFDELTDAINESIPNSTLVSDLLNATLSEVDWKELAEHYADTYKEITVNEIG